MCGFDEDNNVIEVTNKIMLIHSFVELHKKEVDIKVILYPVLNTNAITPPNAQAYMRICLERSLDTICILLALPFLIILLFIHRFLDLGVGIFNKITFLSRRSRRSRRRDYLIYAILHGNLCIFSSFPSSFCFSFRCSGGLC